MTDESEKMARELNEALDIEENASHTQRLITIVRLRTRALKEHETLLELEEVTRQRDQAEQRLLEVLTAHVDFVQDAVTQAHRLQKITDDFQKGIIDRISGPMLDDLDLALAKMREQRDLDPERIDPLDLAMDENAVLRKGRELTQEEIDCFREAHDSPEYDAKKEEHAAAGRQPVPLTGAEGILVDNETRNWLEILAAGGARDGD
jgi:hypothetical protein